MNDWTSLLTRIVSAQTFLLGLLLLQSGQASAVGSTQLDDFSDNSLQNWQMGFASITNAHLSNIADGGPAGIGDNYLQVTADGASVAGGRLTFFNQAQWRGDYFAAGLTSIAMDLRNFSSSETLNLRLGIEGGFFDPSLGLFFGGLFATTASVSLDSGSDWTRVVFSLAPGDLVPVSGASGVTGNDVVSALGNVLELRVLNSAEPDWAGLPVSATLGIDNIAAIPLPPAVWLFASGLIGLVGVLTKARVPG